MATRISVQALASSTGRMERAEVAEQRATRLAAILPTITVLPPKHHVQGLTIELDGSALPVNEWGTPVPVDPGVHTVRAAAPGRQPYQASTESVPVSGRGSIAIPELASALPGPPASDRSERVGAGRLDAQDVAAVASGAIGLGGIIAGSVFGLKSKAKHDDSDPYCTGRVCDDPRGIEIRNEARSLGTRADVSFVIGGLGVASALVFWLARPFGAREAVRTEVGLTTSGIRVRGTW